MTIAVVTGANQGIGKEVCKQLHEKGVTVVLTARNKERGKEAAKEIGCEFHQLEVTDEHSIKELRDYLKKKFGNIDVLVNNAAVFIDKDKGVLDVDADTVRKTFETNLIGPLLVAQIISPLINKGGRIINVSSGAGALTGMGGGYPSYGMSKTALNALTKKLAAELPDLRVNSMCPGWVRTKMGGQNAPRSVEQGADTIVWLATAENTPTGAFLRDREEIAW